MRFVISFSAFTSFPPKFKINNVIIGLMTTSEWAGMILTILSILATVGVGVRWIIKNYVKDILAEMKPNGGSSMKDQITRLEEKTEKIFDLMIEHLKDHSK